MVVREKDPRGTREQSATKDRAESGADDVQLTARHFFPADDAVSNIEMKNYQGLGYTPSQDLTAYRRSPLGHVDHAAALDHGGGLAPDFQLDETHYRLVPLRERKSSWSLSARASAMRRAMTWTRRSPAAAHMASTARCASAAVVQETRRRRLTPASAGCTRSPPRAARACRRRWSCCRRGGRAQAQREGRLS